MMQIQLSHAKISTRFAGSSSRLDQMTRQIKLTEDAQRDQLMQIADKCPVHKTLEAGARYRPRS